MPFTQNFNASSLAPAPLTEAEQALTDWGVVYSRQDDGTIIVKGNLILSNKNLTQLPDLTRVIVKGNFHCDRNQLTSLEGCPAYVGKNFWCQFNQLSDLAGAPAFVGKGFACNNNQLTSLDGAPVLIGEHFRCRHNPLSSLEGAPKEFEMLQSDFGGFTLWTDVPEELRISPKTKKLRLEMLEKISAATVQKQTFKPMPSICFKATPK